VRARLPPESQNPPYSTFVTRPEKLLPERVVHKPRKAGDLSGMHPGPSANAGHNPVRLLNPAIFHIRLSLLEFGVRVTFPSDGAGIKDS